MGFLFYGKSVFCGLVAVGRELVATLLAYGSIFMPCEVQEKHGRA